MSDNTLPSQQRPSGNIEPGPTIRRSRIVGPERSRQPSAVSAHTVDINKMVDLGLESQREVVDAKL